MRVLVLDNYDSFTWNLAQMILARGAACEVHRSDEISLEQIAGRAPDRIVISPGPFGPEATGVCSEVVRSFSTEVPILGICLGMQVIAAVAGARIVESGSPIHGKARRVEHDGRGVFAGLASPLVAGLYHSLVVDTDRLPHGLVVSARGPDGSVMGCRLADKRVEGVLFHPESFLTPDGERLMANFLDQVDVVG